MTDKKLTWDERRSLYEKWCTRIVIPSIFIAFCLIPLWIYDVRPIRHLYLAPLVIGFFISLVICFKIEWNLVDFISEGVAGFFILGICMSLALCVSLFYLIPGMRELDEDVGEVVSDALSSVFAKH